MNSIKARILNLIKEEGELKRSHLYRRIYANSGDLPKSVSWLKKKGFILSRIKRNTNRGTKPEMLNITKEGRNALKMYYD